MSDVLLAPASLPAAFLALRCSMPALLEEDSPLPVLLLVVVVVEAVALLLLQLLLLLPVVVVVVAAVLPLLVVLVIAVLLLAESSAVVGGVALFLVSADFLSKLASGLPGAMSSTEGTTTSAPVELSSSPAGVDAAQEPRIASISL